MFAGRHSSPPASNVFAMSAQSSWAVAAFGNRAYCRPGARETSESAARSRLWRDTARVTPFARLREVPWDALEVDLVLRAIARVLQGEAAEREIDKLLRAHREWRREQRAAAVEAIFGVALWRRRLAWHAGLSARLFNQGGPRPLPSRSLAAPSDIPMILLTSLLRDLPHGAPEPPALADRWSLPDWLAAHLERELGSETDAFCSAISAPGPVCLRANRLLCRRDALAGRLREEHIESRPARAPDALIVETRHANLFGSAAWREGWFEPQDEGSQRAGALVDPAAGETVLDLCAGAGGKSLQLAAQAARVLAYDRDRAKLSRLAARADRAGAEIEIVQTPRPADHVLVDAPCSELGALRRGPDARWRIEPETLSTLPLLQRELLETAARLARKRIVYVTCTLSRAENDDVADAFERAHPEFERSSDFFRTFPQRDGTDGFFAAVWNRRP